MKTFKKVSKILFFVAIFFSFNTVDAETWGKWHVTNLDEGENGVIVASMKCKYSLFVKECKTGRAKLVVGAPPELL